MQPKQCYLTFVYKSNLVCTRGGYFDVVGARRAAWCKLYMEPPKGPDAPACAVCPFRPCQPGHSATAFLSGPSARVLGIFGEISIFSPIAPPAWGPKSGLAGFGAQLPVPLAGRPFGYFSPTFHSKSSLVCTRVGYFDAVGARRAARHGPLGGREGAGIACTLAANAQRGVPGRIVMCHPHPPPSFARRRGSGP